MGTTRNWFINQLRVVPIIFAFSNSRFLSSQNDLQALPRLQGLSQHLFSSKRSWTFQILHGYWSSPWGEGVASLRMHIYIKDCGWIRIAKKQASIPSTKPITWHQLATRKPLDNASCYFCLVGLLSTWLYINRSELSYIVRTCLSQFMQNPKAGHLDVARCVLPYIKVTLGHCILLRVDNDLQAGVCLLWKFFCEAT